MRSRFDILRDIRKIKEKMTDGFSKMEKTAGTFSASRTESIKKITQLRHELKKVDQRRVGGKKGAALKEQLKRQAREERKKQQEQKKSEKARIKKAKQELLENPEELKETLGKMKPKARKKMLKELNEMYG